jgi:hypothetical protein
MEYNWPDYNAPNWWAPGTNTDDLPTNSGDAWRHKIEGDEIGSGGGHTQAAVIRLMIAGKTAWPSKFGPVEISRAEEMVLRQKSSRLGIPPNL